MRTRETVPDFKDAGGKWVKETAKDGHRRVTKGYTTWYNMKMRCLIGGSVQKRFPTYVGCTMSPRFADFQSFVNWAIVQVGYGEKDYALEKDILVSGNKSYNEGVCVFVPQALNKFLVDHAAARGAYPQGLDWSKSACKYRVRVTVNGKAQHIGLYNTIEAARTAYKVAKEVEARRWADRLDAGEFIIDPRVIERMRTWEHICEWSPL